MKSILVLAFTNLDHDARVNRQIDFLRDSYEIHIATFDTSNRFNLPQLTLPSVKPSLTTKIQGAVALLSRRFEHAYKLVYNLEKNKSILDTQSFDLIIANDIETLPLAFKISNRCKVIFDAHEFAPLHFEEKIVWRILFKKFNEYLCKKYIPQTSGMLTVGKGLADSYSANFQCTPLVLTNANYYKEISPTQTKKPIRLVYHGAANPSRQLELMIEAVSMLGAMFTLDLILVTPPIANKKTRKYLSKIEKLVEKNQNVKIVPPVTSSEIINLIRQYDVGVFLLPPVNFNYKNTLPNKLFDYIQARLAVAIGPTPEMASVVRSYRLGVVSSDFSVNSFAFALTKLTPDIINQCKRNAAIAASELNADKNRIILNKLIATILANN